VTLLRPTSGAPCIPPDCPRSGVLSEGLSCTSRASGVERLQRRSGRPRGAQECHSLDREERGLRIHGRRPSKAPPALAPVLLRLRRALPLVGARGSRAERLCLHRGAKNQDATTIGEDIPPPQHPPPSQPASSYRHFCNLGLRASFRAGLSETLCAPPVCQKTWPTRTYRKNV